MPSSARDIRFGRRGGNWLPELVDGQMPYGVVDGKRQACPTPVLAACGCQWACWIAPGQVGKECSLCREPMRAVAA